MAETFTPGKVKQKVVVLAAHPKGMVKESDMRVEEQEIDLAVKEGSGDVVLKVLDISLDPYYRELMEEEDSVFGLPMFKIGQVCEP
jgi:NADPH-dependent curcumin reductase CurA